MSPLDSKSKAVLLTVGSILLLICIGSLLDINMAFPGSTEQSNHPKSKDTVANPINNDANINRVANLGINLNHAANVFPACTKEDLIIMNQHLHRPTMATRCPDSNWIEEFYQKNSGSLDGSFLGVSIGCNKGFDAINTARMGMRNEIFDKKEWNKRLVAHGFDHRGACNQQNTPQFELTKTTGQEGAVSPPAPRKGEMHCVEPTPSIFAFLESAANELNLDKEGLVLTQAAISSRDGTISFPTGHGNEGAETNAMDSCNGPNKEKHMCTDIPMYSLQTYVDTYVKSKGPINILSVDVEGFDFDVLFGAGNVLDRTEYLEFEYHQVGSWGKMHVHDLVNLLDGKGFNCYWAGRRKLWRITHCELEKFDKWHGWSNVACVHRSQNELAQNMEKMFLATIGKKNNV